MTDRLPVHAIDTAGGVAGQVPTINLAGTALEYVTPSAGGGSGGTGRDRRWNAPVTATVIDEFNDDSLAAAWVRVDGTGAPAGNVAWTEGADVLSMVQSAGDTVSGPLHALMRPLASSIAVGDAFVLGIQPFFPTGTFPSVGIALADGVTFGSGNQVIGALGTGSTNTDMIAQTWAYTGYNTRGTIAATSPAVFRNTYSYVRLVCTAANTWRTDLSADGVGWQLGSTVAKTITPTHVGVIATTFGQAGTKFAASFDMLRRYSGVS